MKNIFSIAILVFVLSASTARAEAGNDPFFSTWRLLNSAEKQQFIAGYIYGWRDAAAITDIATQYVKENPQKAVEGLQKVKGLYDMSDLKPALVTQAIDTFYTQPENGDAPLSKAISAAKQALANR